jgi:hypothetical protein
MTSLESYREAIHLIDAAGGGDFEGRKPAVLVAKAAAALGVVFPPSYEHFLLERGCGNIGRLEILGLIDDNFDRSSVPNGVWLTLEERKSIGLDPAWVLIAELGDGGYDALDMHRRDASGECPVVRLSTEGALVETVAPNFGQYLLEAVRQVV